MGTSSLPSAAERSEQLLRFLVFFLLLVMNYLNPKERTGQNPQTLTYRGLSCAQIAAGSRHVWGRHPPDTFYKENTDGPPGNKTHCVHGAGTGDAVSSCTQRNPKKVRVIQLQLPAPARDVLFLTWGSGSGFWCNSTSQPAQHRAGCAFPAPFPFGKHQSLLQAPPSSSQAAPLTNLGRSIVFDFPKAVLAVDLARA